MPVGCFLFHRDGEETGSLEDHLGPMVEAEWPQRTQAAGEFIDAYMEAGDPRGIERLQGADGFSYLGSLAFPTITRYLTRFTTRTYAVAAAGSGRLMDRTVARLLSEAQ